VNLPEYKTVTMFSSSYASSYGLSKKYQKNSYREKKMKKKISALDRTLICDDETAHSFSSTCSSEYAVPANALQG
jgi:hypothetical protein